VTAVTDPERRGTETAFIATPCVAPLKEPSMFKTNVGTLDRIARVVLGLALIALTLTGAIGVWGWIGVVPLATAAFSTCPLYSLLGVSTCPLKKG
jgi:Protein of unknown function (DUF2892)